MDAARNWNGLASNRAGDSVGGIKLSQQTMESTPLRSSRREQSTSGAPHRTAMGLAARAVRLAKKVVTSCGVLYLIGPHTMIPRIFGPRIGLAWARAIANVHWLTTFLGAQGSARRAIKQLYPRLDTDLSVSQILRRYLVLKHHSFMEWRLSTTPRGKLFLSETYSDFPGHTIIDESLEEGDGVMTIVYHFGMYKLLTVGLSEAFGYDISQVNFRSKHYSGDTFKAVASAAYRNALQTDKHSGMQAAYLKPQSTVIGLMRDLRKGKIVGLAGDGTIAGNFIDVPFLGGSLQLPTGWARLAAKTKAPVVVMFAMLDGIGRREIVTFPAVRSEDSSEEAVNRMVRQCAGHLEDFVKRAPWAWHVWHRLEIEETPAGELRMKLKAAKQGGDPAEAPAER